MIAAPAVDGELDSATLGIRLKDLHAQRLPDLTADDLDSIRDVFTWHPSEASGLLAAAADGHRGYVEVRDAGDQIELTDDTPSLHVIDVTELAVTSPAVALIETTTLRDAEATIQRLTGISEIRYETEKAARRHGRSTHQVTSDDLPLVDQHVAEATHRGADYISLRRLSELIGATTLDSFTALGQLLAQERPDAYAPSIYQTH